MSRHSRWFLLLASTLAIASVLAACSGAGQPATIAPAGAGQGLNTLIYVYADN